MDNKNKLIETAQVIIDGNKGSGSNGIYKFDLSPGTYEVKIIDSSARFEKKMFHYFSFYVGGDNLLDDEYLMWENYPHPGLQFYFGIKAKW